MLGNNEKSRMEKQSNEIIFYRETERAAMFGGNAGLKNKQIKRRKNP